jgi:tRNA pseudouridine13 synthase
MFFKDYAYFSKNFTGIGGSVKQQPHHFLVNEILLISPASEGEHLYLKIEKTDLNTTDVKERLTQIFSLKDSEIGYAGLKDKRSIAVQHFSLPYSGLNKRSPEDIIKKINDSDLKGIKVTDSFFYHEKLHLGQIKENEFSIFLVLSGNDESTNEALNKAVNIYNHLKIKGFPNYFGEQRFGHDYANVLFGRRVLSDSMRPSKWKRNMYLSAVQSYIFNLTLSDRINNGTFGEPLNGDLILCENSDAPVIFDKNQNVTSEINCNRSFQITGPIHGIKMPLPSGDVLKNENSVLERERLKSEKFDKAGLTGGRRNYSVFPFNFKAELGEDNNTGFQGIWFHFSLPKGSYATSILREIIKNNEEVPD